MGFTLKIHFHGTVALVPLDAQNTKVAMLLPRFKKGGVEKPLVAYVRFLANSYVGKGRKLNFSKEGKANAHIVLDRELLSLDANFAGKEILDADFSHDPSSNIPGNKDGLSLHWLPTIERLTPETGGVIMGELLKLPFKRKKSPSLAARFDVTRGTLTTNGVSDKAVDFVRMQSKAATRVVIARESVLTIDIAGDSVTLRSTNLKDMSRSKANDMTFVPPKGTTELVVVIGNEPKEDIYALHDAMKLVVSDEAAKEFNAFYQLTQQPVTDPALPMGASKGGVHQLCANAVFKSGS